MEKLIVPQGEFELARFPHRESETLRAWDAADEYLLRHLHGEELPGGESSVLLLNDSFGALAVALADRRPQSVSDSCLAQRGALANLERNGGSADSVKLLGSLDGPDGAFDLVLIKIPKSLALLEDQLHRIRPHLRAGALVLGAGMTKGIHSSTLDLFERILGPTRTSLASKKARLIFCEPEVGKDSGASPYPKDYLLEGSDYRILNHAGVFSRESLDIGTRFFLEQIPRSEEPRRIVDLGCGNGVVGLVAAERNPEALLIFLDESFMAVASAEANFRAAFGEARKAEFRAADCLEGVPEGSVDMVLNNPPFHQQSAVGDGVAWQMFRESKKVLRRGGELWVIGNRHLGYHSKLARLFGNCELVASNKKFVILKALR